MANDTTVTKVKAAVSQIRIIALIVIAFVVLINVFFASKFAEKLRTSSEKGKPGTEAVADTNKTVAEMNLPYYIEVDKLGKIVSIYTTNEEGKYETLVRQCICAVGESMDKLPDGYYKLKNSKYKWNVVLSQGEPMRAQYTTRITGDYIFHSAPYTKTEKDALDVKQYGNLGKSASRGYIWLTVECAKWIYDNCPAGTPVRIFEGEYNAELIDKLCPLAPTEGWEPTDPENPNSQSQYDAAAEPKPCLDVPLYNYNFKWADGEGENK